MAASGTPEAMAAQDQPRVAKESPKVLHQVLIQDPTIPFPHRLRMQWWEQNAPSWLANLPEQGLTCPVTLPAKLSLEQKSLPPPILQQGLEIMSEYLQIGAVKEVPLSSAKHLIPWFVVKKTESDGSQKLRLISDCRELNQYFFPEHFKMDNWKDIFPLLRKNMWAAKVDLKHAYFHLPVSGQLQPYLCHKVGEKVFQFQGAPFGLNVLPQIWTQLMKCFQKRWWQAGFQVFLYLDDIILLGSTPLQVNKQLKTVLSEL